MTEKIKLKTIYANNEAFDRNSFNLFFSAVNNSAIMPPVQNKRKHHLKAWKKASH